MQLLGFHLGAFSLCKTLQIIQVVDLILKSMLLPGAREGESGGTLHWNSK